MNKVLEIPQSKSEKFTKEQENIEIYNDFIKSREKKQILKGTVIGCHQNANCPNSTIHWMAVLSYRGWQVLIPASLMGFEILNKEELTEKELNTVYKNYIMRMLSAEISFIVHPNSESINSTGKRVVGNRELAINKERETYYYKENKNGKSKMEKAYEENALFKGRVITISRNMAVVDLYGYQVSIWKGDISWRYLDRIEDFLQVNEIVPIKIEELKIDKENKKIEMKASIKAANPNIMKENMLKYTEESYVLGRITGARDGYFVQVGSYATGIDVYCKKVNTIDTPNIGDTVTIKLYIFDYENGRVFGSIEGITKRKDPWAS